MPSRYVYGIGEAPEEKEEGAPVKVTPSSEDTQDYSISNKVESTDPYIAMVLDPRYLPLNDR